MATPPKGSRSGAKPRNPAMIAFGRPAPQRPATSNAGGAKRGQARAAVAKTYGLTKGGQRKGANPSHGSKVQSKYKIPRAASRASRPAGSASQGGSSNPSPFDLIPQDNLFHQIGNKIKKATGG